MNFKKVDVFTVINWILSLSIIALLGFLIFNYIFGRFGRSAVKVELVHDKARVIINDTDKGETPVYFEAINYSDIAVKINGATNSYNTTIKPASGTEAIIKRDLGVGENFYSGQNVWLEKNLENDPKVIITSGNADSVQILVNDMDLGRTPITFTPKDVLQESTTNGSQKLNIVFKKDGYEDQSIEGVEFKPGFIINIKVDMFAKPIPKEIIKIDGYTGEALFLNLTEAYKDKFSDKKIWARAINYWLKTRGSVNFSDKKIDSFKYFILEDGKILDAAANEISKEDLTFGPSVYIAYVASSVNKDLSQKAIEILKGESVSTTNSATSGSTPNIDTTTFGFNVEIIDTGLGFLRVREKASTTAKEISKVDVGKKFKTTNYQKDWYEIEYETGKKGWVSAKYCKKI